MVSFMRKTNKPEEVLVVVVNFANVEQEFAVGVTLEGKYKEILNTDAKCYGGLGRVNGKAISVSEDGVDGKPYSFTVKSAPLSASIFSFVPYTEREKQQIAKKKAELKAQKRAEEAMQAAEEAKKIALAAAEEAKAAKELAKEAEKRAKEAEKNAQIEMQKALDEQKQVEIIRKQK